jgi:hypothetical protein
MSQAAKFGDPVIGVDVHMVMVPTLVGAVATPLPHAFVGIVFDPLGALIRAGGPACCLRPMDRASRRRKIAGTGTLFSSSVLAITMSF